MPPGESPVIWQDAYVKISTLQVTDDTSEGLDSVDICSSSSPPPVSLFSPKATQMAGCIRICEKKHWAKSKLELNLRQELQECLVSGVASRESEQLKRFEEFMELKQRQEYQSMRDMMEKETQESLGRQEKLKEEHRHRMKILNLRLREAEQQRLREAELERQRQLEGRDRLRALNAIQEEKQGKKDGTEGESLTKSTGTMNEGSSTANNNLVLLAIKSFGDLSKVKIDIKEILKG
ncbi:hypothetical protein QTP70_008502 [Hemibagrus guttatus]|uniref:Uncharacterized protein n=1 Tax=Hemibagrus guttatus TaxID=175788 RepID=A0AAE0R0H6_9TELE|nr:hypothetical protein QTP70_008502 [Hemibagrus guttatus]